LKYRILINKAPMESLNEELNQSEKEEEKEVPARQYKSAFNSKGVEEICPFKTCGRKFTSGAQLKVHVERRHPKIEGVQETSSHVEVVMKPKGTPIPTKNLAPGNKILDVEKKAESSSKKDYFKAHPRPVTAYQRQSPNKLSGTSNEAPDQQNLL
jgi:hypothetical protein